MNSMNSVEPSIANKQICFSSNLHLLNGPGFNIQFRRNTYWKYTAIRLGLIIIYNRKKSISLWKQLAKKKNQTNTTVRYKAKAQLPFGFVFVSTPNKIIIRFGFAITITTHVNSMIQLMKFHELFIISNILYMYINIQWVNQTHYTKIYI